LLNLGSFWKNTKVSRIFVPLFPWSIDNVLI
jgi:hypothetical protein